MAARTAIDWAAVRLAYETTTETATGIAARLGLTRQSLGRRAREEGWVRPLGLGTAEVDVPAMIEALQRTTARLVAVMEVRIGTAGEGVDEKDVRALGALAGTLAKVITLNADARSARDGHAADPRRTAGADAAAGPDEDAAIDEIVALAERFVASRRPEGLGGGAAAGPADRADALLADDGAARSAGPAG